MQCSSARSLLPSAVTFRSVHAIFTKVRILVILKVKMASSVALRAILSRAAVVRPAVSRGFSNNGVPAVIGLPRSTK